MCYHYSVSSSIIRTLLTLKNNTISDECAYKCVKCSISDKNGIPILKLLQVCNIQYDWEYFSKIIELFETIDNKKQAVFAMKSVTIMHCDAVNYEKLMLQLGVDKCYRRDKRNGHLLHFID